MKRFGFVVLMAALVVLLTASFAYASTFSDYVAWSTAGDNADTPTPHKDFQTTTVKCAVCHAVHKGNPAGQVLLRAGVDNACEYCHISNFIGNFKLYGGDTTVYTGDVTTAHNAGTGSACVDCHAVHGAGTITNATFGDVTTKILKSSTGMDYQAEAFAVWNPATEASSRDGIITTFCSQCHPYYQTAYNGTIDTGSGGVGGPFQSHIMGAANGTYGNSTAHYAGRVANVASTYCRSCHDAGLTNESVSYTPASLYASSNNFPHYTENNSRFLIAAPYDTGTHENVTNASADGACLKCHVWNTGSNGVGVDY